MSIGPGDSVSVPIVADTSKFAAQVATELEAAMAKVSGEVFTPLSVGAERAGLKAGEELGAGVVAGTQTILPKLAAEGAEAGTAFGTRLGETAVESAKSLIAPLAAIFAAEEIGKFFKDAVSDASSAQKSIETAQSFFGAGFASIQESAEGASTAIGLSEQGYLAASRTLGALGARAGLTGDDLSKFTEDAIQRGGDLAAEFGKSVPDALKALQSGLAGNVRGLRQFGVQITSQDITNEAYAKGIAKSGTALTTQQKILAASALIFDQTSSAQDQFAKHSGDLAQQEDILKAKVKNLAEAFGTELLPIATKGATVLLDVIDVGGKVVGVFEHNEVAAIALATVLGTSLIPKIAGTVAVYARFAAIAAAETAANIARSALAIIPAMTGAAAATEAEGAALDTLDFNPVIAGVTVLATAATGVAIAVEHVHDTYNEVAASGSELVRSLNDQHDSALASTASVATMVAELRQLQTEQDGAGVAAFSYQSRIDALSAAIAEQGGVAGTERGNVAALAKEYGISGAAVDAYAQKNKINLLGSLADLSAAFDNVVSKGTRVDKDFIELADTTQTVADHVDALDDAWNRLVGNFVGAKSARLAVHDDLDALDVALKKSNGSLSLSVKGGEDSRKALLQLVPAIGQGIDAVYKSTGSYAAAQKAGDEWLQGIKDSGAAGPLVDDLTQKIQGYLSRLVGAAPPLGGKTVSGYAAGIRSQAGAAYAAAAHVVAEASAGFAATEAPFVAAGESAGHAYTDAVVSTINSFLHLPAVTPHVTAPQHGGSGRSGRSSGTSSTVPSGTTRRNAADQTASSSITFNIHESNDPHATAAAVVNRLAAGTVGR